MHDQRDALARDSHQNKKFANYASKTLSTLVSVVIVKRLTYTESNDQQLNESKVMEDFYKRRVR